MTRRGVLIGCGFFAENHMNAWADLPVEIAGVCDLDAEKAAAMAARFGARPFTDAAAMLAEVAPDFVDIATQAPTHRPLVELAARHAPTIICQKPFAETYHEAAAMVAAADAAGATLAVHENFRWQAGFMAVKARLDAGEIGAPHFARVSFRHGYDNYVNQPYLETIERFAIMDVGLHLYDVTRWLMGEVTHLTAATQRYNPTVRGEDAFSAQLRHEGGGVSLVDCSFQTRLHPEPFPESWVWIEGPKGTLELRTDFTLMIHAETRSAVNVEPPAPRWGGRPWHNVQDSVINFQRHMLAVMAGETHAQPSGADNLRTMALALASYDSAAGARTIDMGAWRP